MRLVFAIPHYFSPSKGRQHGSLSNQPARRLESLRRCVTGLHQSFGMHQSLNDAIGRRPVEANDRLKSSVDIVICTTGDAHLMGEFNLGLCRHNRTKATPMLLGYECHDVLRQCLGRYDFYCYLEDDLLVSDPLFFQKLAWFCGIAGEDALLQPNRFEVASDGRPHKLYCDGNIVDPSISPRYQNRADRPRVKGSLMNQDFAFQRVDNPHAGAFFLNEAQMAEWATKPYFLDRASGFWGPLESAATLGIMRTFRVYKPARENAAFLEIQHLDPQLIDPKPAITAGGAPPAYSLWASGLQVRLGVK